MADNLNPFLDKVLDEFTEDITDRIFQMIEEDEGLMKEYNTLKEEMSAGTINSRLGKKVREHFRLQKTDRRKKAESSLISEYQVHRKR